MPQFSPTIRSEYWIEYLDGYQHVTCGPFVSLHAAEAWCVDNGVAMMGFEMKLKRIDTFDR